jgi:hypothetical protein
VNTSIFFLENGGLADGGEPSPPRSTRCRIGDEALSGSTETKAIIDRVLKLDAMRCDAIVAGDVKTLDSMIADDFVYTHASGHVDTKETYMAARRSGSVQFVKFERENVKARVFHSVVVFLSGQLRSWLRTGQQEKTNHHHFTAVWIKTAEDWRLANFEATNIADAKTNGRTQEKAAAGAVR